MCLNKWKDSPCSWTGINTLKLSILSKAVQMFNAISIKISMALITEIEKIVLELVWNHKMSITKDAE